MHNRSRRYTKDFEHVSREMQAMVILIGIAGVASMLLNSFALTGLHRRRRHVRPHYEPREILLMSLCMTDCLVGINSLVDSLLFAFSKRSVLTELSQITMYICKFSGHMAILHIIFITGERLLSARFPIFHRNHCTALRTSILAAFIWVASNAPCIPAYFEYGRVFAVTVGVLMVTADLVVVCSYAYILRVVIRQVELQEECSVDQDRQSKLHKIERRATLTSFFIVLSTLAFTLPPAAYFLGKTGKLATRYTESGVDLAVIVLVLTIRSCMDPVVYIHRMKLSKCVHQWSRGRLRYWWRGERFGAMHDRNSGKSNASTGNS